MTTTTVDYYPPGICDCCKERSDGGRFAVPYYGHLCDLCFFTMRDADALLADAGIAGLHLGPCPDHERPTDH